MNVKIAIALQIKFLISISKRTVGVCVLQQVSLTLVVARCSGLKLVEFVVMNTGRHAYPARAYESKRYVGPSLHTAFGETKIETLRQRIQINRINTQSGQKTCVTGAVQIRSPERNQSRRGRIACGIHTSDSRIAQ